MKIDKGILKRMPQLIVTLLAGLLVFTVRSPGRMPGVGKEFIGK
jgi:hypothetical protein